MRSRNRWNWNRWIWIGGLLLGVACGSGPRPLPSPPRPPAGYWFDAYRERRAQLAHPALLAGSAKVKLTPQVGVRIAGHGFNKHSQGVLDDLYARVLYLDAGDEAVALVSLDFIGLALPRVERIRARVSQHHGDRILIACTHNHAGPDTLGYWGPAVLYLIPVRSGIDPDYLEWVEARVAQAIERAVATARPARLFAGSFQLPEGLLQNLREPEVVDRNVTVLRVAARDGFTIGTVVNAGVHAESLQDLNRWLSADFPGVLTREVDRVLGGVTLFFTAPAGGMIEPANRPEDPEAARRWFRERLGGALAEGVLQQVIGGMEELSSPRLRLRTEWPRFPVQVGGLLELAMRLGLLEARPLSLSMIRSEMALLDLGGFRLLTVPGEPTLEVAAELAGILGPGYNMVVGLGMDELGYMLSERQWQDPRFEYERSMSLGQETARRLLDTARALVSAGE